MDDNFRKALTRQPLVRPVTTILLLGVCASVLSAEEPKPAPKPAAEADAVFAVYYNHLDIASSRPGLSVIFAAWQDGRVAWSKDRFYGGPPYRTGRVEQRRVADLLARLDSDGLFADDNLNGNYHGHHSEYLVIRVRFGKKARDMSSWHELIEASGKDAAIEGRIEALDGRRRLDVLRKAPPDYRHFRFVWAETRARLAELTPVESTATEGKPVWDVGRVLYWQDPGTPPKSKDPERPAGK
jgi:hypothetical protein